MDAVLRVREQKFQRGRDQLEKSRGGKVPEPGLLRADHRPPYHRGRSLETDADKDHFAGGLGGGQRHRVQRGIDHADVRATLARGLQVEALGPLYLEHVAESGDDDARQRGQGKDAVDIALRGDADGAAGPGQHAELFGEQLAHPAGGYGHGMRPADLHEIHLPAGLRGGGGGQPAYLGEGGGGQGAVAPERGGKAFLRGGLHGLAGPGALPASWA